MSITISSFRRQLRGKNLKGFKVSSNSNFIALLLFHHSWISNPSLKGLVEVKDLSTYQSWNVCAHMLKFLLGALLLPLCLNPW
jgi:hypothetical protein